MNDRDHGPRRRCTAAASSDAPARPTDGVRQIERRVESARRTSRARLATRLLTALAVVLAACISALALAQDGGLDQRVFEIARQLRCPVCVSESVADSNARVSIEMREVIQQQLEEGRSEAEILAFFQNRYGDWILLEPPRRGVHLVVWLLPVIAVVLAAVGLGMYVRRWLAAGRATPDVDDADLERVRRELGGSARVGDDA